MIKRKINYRESLERIEDRVAVLELAHKINKDKIKAIKKSAFKQNIIKALIVIATVVISLYSLENILMLKDILPILEMFS